MSDIKCVVCGDVIEILDEYADGYADITYSICPKGHKKQINRSERR